MHRKLSNIAATLTIALTTSLCATVPLSASAAFVDEADALRACERAISRQDDGAGRPRFERDYGRARSEQGFTFYINASVPGADGESRQALRSLCRARGFGRVDKVVTLPGRWDLNSLTAPPDTLMASEH